MSLQFVKLGLLCLLLTALAACGTSSAPGAGAPDIVTFNANPSSITAGASTALSWYINGEADLSISNVGKVYGSTGSISVNPANTTTYTLTATNASGTDVLGVTVTVTGSPPTTPENPEPPDTPGTPEPPDTPDNPLSAPANEKEGAQDVLGRWTFSYSIGGVPYTDTFNLTEVINLYDDEYVASGEDQYGGSVIGGYDFEYSNSYYIFSSSPYEYTGIDANYDFQFTGSDTVTGQLSYYDRFTKEFSGDIPFTGTRN